MLTDEDVKRYASLDGEEQIEEYNRIIDNGNFKTLNELVDALSQIWENTSTQNTEQMRNNLIDYTLRIDDTLAKRRVQSYAVNDFRIGRTKLNNDIDQMLGKLFAIDDAEKREQLIQEYMTKKYDEKQYFQLAKLYSLRQNKSIEEFNSLYNTFLSQTDNYFEDINGLETDEQKAKAISYGSEKLVEELIESTPNHIIENPELIGKIIADGKCNVATVFGKLTKEQQLKNIDIILEQMIAHSNNPDDFISLLNSLDKGVQDSQQLKEYIAKTVQGYLERQDLSIYTKTDLFKILSDDIQEDLSDNLSNMILENSSFRTGKIWAVANEKLQNKIINNVIEKIHQDGTDEKHKIASIWSRSEQSVQEQNADLFWKIYDSIDGLSFPDFWKGTKNQEKFFEQLYQKIREEDNGNRVFAIDIQELWKSTNEDLQRKYFSTILKQNPEQKEKIFSATNESIQIEYFAQKENELQGQENPAELAELYAGLSENIKKEKPDLFWRLYGLYIEKDYNLAVKLWDSMGKEFQDQNFNKAFEFVRNDPDKILNFWKATKNGKDYNEYARIIFLETKDNPELFIAVVDSSQLADGLIKEALELQEGNIKTQIKKDKLAAFDKQYEKKQNTYKPSSLESFTLKKYSVSNTLDIRGYRVEDALDTLEGWLDEASLANISPVTVIHGHGTGALKSAVRDFLSTSPYVASFRAGNNTEGGDGVSIIDLK